MPEALRELQHRTLVDIEERTDGRNGADPGQSGETCRAGSADGGSQHPPVAIHEHGAQPRAHGGHSGALGEKAPCATARPPSMAPIRAIAAPSNPGTRPGYE